MGILQTLFDNEWLQRADIDRIGGRLARSSMVVQMQAGELRKRVRALEGDIDELALLVRSLYVYLKRTGDFDAEAFATIIKEIDAQDGVIDGKATKRRMSPSKATTTKKRSPPRR